ncbi:hypothetical protein ACLOJK_020242 [Asimina triloba]
MVVLRINPALKGRLALGLFRQTLQHQHGAGSISPAKILPSLQHHPVSPAALMALPFDLPTLSNSRSRPPSRFLCMLRLTRVGSFHGSISAILQDEKFSVTLSIMRFVFRSLVVSVPALTGIADHGLSDMTSQLELERSEEKQPEDKQVNGIFWIILLNLGKLVEEEEGSLGLWISYILTGAGANIVSWLVLPRNAVSVGASGAVFGLFAISVLVKMCWDWRKILEVLILGQFVIQKVMEAAHASAGLSGTFSRSYAVQNVNHIAHLSGALVGVSLVLLINRISQHAESDVAEK